MNAYCPELYEVVPGARFVMSVRDPRDIVASMIEVSNRKLQKKMQGYPQIPRDVKLMASSRDVESMASKLMTCYEPCLACRDPGFRARLLYVKYEDLVSDPSSVIADMQSWTGLDLSEFDPAGEWPRSLRDFDVDREIGTPYITEPYGKAITARSIGRYKNTLSVEETLTVERMCAPLMQAFDYLPSESS